MRPIIEKPRTGRGSGYFMKTVKWLLKVAALVLVIVTGAWFPLSIYTIVCDGDETNWVWRWLYEIVKPIDLFLSSRA